VTRDSQKAEKLEKEIERLRKENDRLRYENALLTENSEKFSAAFRSNPNALILSYKDDGRIIDVNDGFINLFEWSKNEALDKTTISLNIYSDPGERDNLISLLKEEGRIVNYETSLESKTGRYLTGLLSMESLSYSEDTIILTTIQDITERKKAEKALEDSERRYSALFNNSTLGIAHCRVMISEDDKPVNYKILRINDAYTRITGLTKDDIEGKTAKDVFSLEGDYPYEHLGIYSKVALEGIETNIESFFSRFNKWLQIYVYSPKKGEFTAIFSDITDRKKIEEELKESEERFRTLADNIAPFAWMANPSGKVFWFNKRWLEYTGTTPGEMVKKGWPRMIHPNHVSRVVKSFRRAIQTGENYEETFPLRGKDGQFRWYISRALPIKDKEGRILRWFGTNSDITEQRKTEESLRRSEQRLEGIFNDVAIGIIEVDAENHISTINARACDILGYTPRELLGRSIQEITFPEDIDITNELNTKLHNGEINIFDYEKRYIKKDGSLLWAHVTVSSVRNSDGQHINSIGTVEDISEKKRSLDALRESELKFRLLFENITEGVALFELVCKESKAIDYRLLSINPAFSELAGLDPETAKGLLGTQLDKSPVPNRFKEYAEVALTGKPFRFETFNASMNRHLVVNVISPKRGQFAVVFEDITEQKKNEMEIKQKNEELTRFIYTVSHDLKSPLVTIKSFTSYLREDIENQDKEAQDKDINYVQNAADKMGKLLDELLELSRIGRKEKPKSHYPLETIVQSALDLVAGRLDQKKVQVKVSVSGIMVYGHSQRLIQLYQNLIDNSAKFMINQPHPLIEIGAYNDESRNNEIVLFVRDNGSGIDPRYHHKIFGLFEKMDTSTEGTGIGLALVKRIVEVHGGTIWFTSEGMGKGTTFYLTLERTQLIKTEQI
jgi:PAS domain S-box-containing protein